MANSIPGCEVTIMKGLGHFPMSEDPQAFLTHLLPVLEKIAGIRLARQARYLPGRARQRAFPERSVDLRHGRAAIGLALAVEPLLMGAEIGDPRPDLGLEFLPQVGTRRRGRSRYRPWRFHGTSNVETLLISLLAPGSGRRLRAAANAGKAARKGLWPDGWFRVPRRIAMTPTRDRFLGIRRLAGHRLNERHRLRDQEIAFLHPFHETPRPKSLHQTPFVESSASERGLGITAALLRAR